MSPLSSVLLIILQLVVHNNLIVDAGNKIQLSGSEPGYLCTITTQYGIPMCRAVSIADYAHQKEQGDNINATDPINCFDTEANGMWQLCYQYIECNRDHECIRKCEKVACVRISLQYCPGVFIFKGTWCTASRAAYHIGSFYDLEPNEAQSMITYEEIDQKYCGDIESGIIHFSDCKKCRLPFCPK